MTGDGATFVHTCRAPVPKLEDRTADQVGLAKQISLAGHPLLLYMKAMDATGSHEANRRYYDAFSKGYERLRGLNDPGGYHELLDELESTYVQRFGAGKDILEVGCGTGLVLARLSQFARTAKGIDLSPGMLDLARAKGLDVIEGSALELPFRDDSFDVVCSFKVLPHIPQVDCTLAEMARVTRPGGYILAEFYNPYSLRGLLKRFGPKRPVAAHATEGDVFLRLDSPKQAKRLTPLRCTYIGGRGVRIFIPAGAVMRVPGVKNALRRLELRACDGALGRFGGFWIATYQKQS